MAEQTPRFGIGYPSFEEQPFFTSFEAGILAIDALLFADFEGRNIIGFGGGTLSWDGTDLSFTEDIEFVSPTFAQKLTWAASESPISIPAGEFLVVALARGSTIPVTLTQAGGTPSVITTASVPISGHSMVVCYHNPDDGALYFWNGLVIPSGTSTTGLTMSPVVERFNNVASPLVTGSAAASGGTVNFEIEVGAGYVDVKALRAVSNAGSLGGNFQLFRDSARLQEIYAKEFKDELGTDIAYTVDRNPATMLSDAFLLLTDGKLYGRITNGGATASTYNVQVIAWGLGG